jgi:hypothetical protein
VCAIRWKLLGFIGYPVSWVAFDHVPPLLTPIAKPTMPIPPVGIVPEMEVGSAKLASVFVNVGVGVDEPEITPALNALLNKLPPDAFMVTVVVAPSVQPLTYHIEKLLTPELSAPACVKERVFEPASVKVTLVGGSTSAPMFKTTMSVATVVPIATPVKVALAPPPPAVPAVLYAQVTLPPPPPQLPPQLGPAPVIVIWADAGE